MVIDSHPSDEGLCAVQPVSHYVLVFVGLASLTLLSLVCSLVDLGLVSLLLALSFSAAMALGVAVNFMHLRRDQPIFVLIILSALLFFAIFFGLTFLDLSTRDSVLPEEASRPLTADERPGY